MEKVTVESLHSVHDDILILTIPNIQTIRMLRNDQGEHSNNRTKREICAKGNQSKYRRR
jgi:hypothetical protein